MILSQGFKYLHTEGDPVATPGPCVILSGVRIRSDRQPLSIKHGNMGTQLEFCILHTKTYNSLSTHFTKILTTQTLVNILLMAPRIVYCSIINLLWSLKSKMSMTFRSVSYGPCSRTGVTCVASDFEAIHVTPVCEQGPSDRNIVLIFDIKLQIPK